MKTLLFIIVCFCGLNAVAQVSSALTEEKASAWIRVPENRVPVSRPKVTSTVRKKSHATRHKPPVKKENANDEFEKTNSEVNRFKKKKD